MSKYIKLTQGKKTLVDDEDYEYLNQFKWFYNNGYACKMLPRNGKPQKATFIHKLVMNNPSKRVDHINGDTLDNRKENLRLVTHSQNIINSKKRKNCTSKYKGVFRNKKANKWQAQIRVKQKAIHLGYFTDEVKAAKAYNKAAIKYFKEYARINKI